MSNNIPPLANPELQWQTAVSAFRQGNFAQTQQLLKPLLSLPNLNGEVLLLAGMAEAELNNLDAAETYLSKAVAKTPNRVEGWATLGNIKRERGDSLQAIEHYKKALNVAPKHVGVLSTLGLTLNDVGLCYEALQSFDKVLKIDPKLDLAIYGRLHALKVLRRSQEVIATYKDLIKASPNDPALYLALAEFYESCNQPEDARSALPPDKLVNTATIKSRLLALKSQLSLREHDYETALSYVAQAKSQEETEALNYQAGFILDKLKRYDEAFAAFKKGNELKAKIFQTKRLNIDAAPTYIEQKIRAGIQMPTVSSPVTGGKTLHFIVGLPRSGTTLLDRMLDAHPDIQVFEEFNALRVADNALENGASVKEARRLYWESIEKYIPLDKNKIFIDKNPLNSMIAGIIPRLFPSSQVIIALRHPFDAALSCYMQNFDINSATLQFLDLKRTGNFCAQLLVVLKQLEQARPEYTQRVYYESLVKDYQQEITTLLEKMNIPWHNDVLNYRQKLQQAGNIHTASYAQVMEKPNQNALARWKRYESLINDITTPLKEAADFFYRDQ